MAQREMSVLVCGNYGYRTNQIDGQTIKTRTLKEASADVLDEANVRAVDSSFFPGSPIRFLYEARKGFKECNQVVMLFGCRGLQVFLSFLLHWKRKCDPPLQYFVVGSWLPNLFGKKVGLRCLCLQLDDIYVQTSVCCQVTQVRPRIGAVQE